MIKINKRTKIVCALVVVASNAVTIGVVAFARPTQRDYVHDGRYAYCDVVTNDGVTDHLDAFVARCDDDATNERLAGS
jgi:hypothetical protein